MSILTQKNNYLNRFMETKGRFLFFGFGFLLGITLLLILFKNRPFTYFSKYLPQGRVLESIYNKKIVFSTKNIPNDYEKIFDTVYFKHRFLKEAKVDFGKSNARKKPCGEYWLSNDTIQVLVENCVKEAIIREVRKLN